MTNGITTSKLGTGTWFADTTLLRRVDGRVVLVFVTNLFIEHERFGEGGIGAWFRGG